MKQIAKTNQFEFWMFISDFQKIFKLDYKINHGLKISQLVHISYYKKYSSVTIFLLCSNISTFTTETINYSIYLIYYYLKRKGLYLVNHLQNSQQIFVGRNLAAKCLQIYK